MVETLVRIAGRNSNFKFVMALTVNLNFPLLSTDIFVKTNKFSFIQSLEVLVKEVQSKFIVMWLAPFKDITGYVLPGTCIGCQFIHVSKGHHHMVRSFHL